MKTILPFVLAIILLCGGCDMFKSNNEITTIPELNTGKDITQAQKTIEESSKEITSATEDITKETQIIKDEATATKGKLPADIKEKIDPHLDKITASSSAIETDAQNINKAVANLSGAESVLKNASMKIVNIEKALIQIEKERDSALIAQKEAEEARDSALHNAIKWLIMASIVGAGALGVFGFMYSSKMCLTLAAVCVVVMSIAIFVETAFIYLVIGGGLILASLVGLTIYNIILQKKAFKEVVDTVEVAQSQMSDSARKILFGGEGETGVMDTIQSPSTMELVKKEKSRMSTLWSYAKRKNGTQIK